MTSPASGHEDGLAPGPQAPIGRRLQEVFQLPTFLRIQPEFDHPGILLWPTAGEYQIQSDKTIGALYRGICATGACASLPPPPPKNCQTCEAVNPLLDKVLLFLQSLTQAQRRIGGIVGCEQALLAMRTLVPIVGDDKAGEGVTGD
jgi:hypothetical protein